MAKKWQQKPNGFNASKNTSKDELIAQFKFESIKEAFNTSNWENIENDYSAFKQQLMENEEERNEELLNEYEEKKSNLTKEYNNKLQALEEEKLDFENEKEKQLQALRENQELYVAEYRKSIKQQIDDEYADEKKQIESEITSLKSEYEKTQQEIQKKISEIDEFYRVKQTVLEENYVQRKLEIERELEERQQKIQDDLKNLEIEKKRFDREKDALLFQKELLDEEKILIESLKERYSPKRVKELEFEVDECKKIMDVSKIRIEELTARNILMKNQLPSSKEELEIIVTESSMLKDMNITLQQDLANLPSKAEVEVLRSKSSLVDGLKEDLFKEQVEKREIQERLDRQYIGIRELETTRKVAKTLDSLNKELQEEIEKMHSMYNSSSVGMFQGLKDVDHELKEYAPASYSRINLSLEGIVDYIRNYGATMEGLYYSEKQLRSYLAGMATSQFLILQGLSGTGKSSLPRLMHKSLGCNHELFAVQPSWRDNRELLGYHNDFTKKFKETQFTKFIYKHSSPHYMDSLNIAVLDEMNLARIEYYFADFLAAMEEDPSKWHIHLVSSNAELDEEKLPKYLVNNVAVQLKENTWFVGTVNRDESTFAITNKVYDRAMVVDFYDRSKSFEGQKVKQIKVSFTELNALFKNAISNSKYGITDADWENVMKIDKYLKEELEITFGNRMEKQLKKYVPVYVACGGSKEEAIDYFFAYKVLRQLEDKYEPHLLTVIKGLKELLVQQYGQTFTESMRILEKKEGQLGGQKNH